MDRQHIEPEEWRPIPSLPGVMASSWGRVHKLAAEKDWRGRSGRKTRPTFGAKRHLRPNYPTMVVHWKGTGLRKVSRLVLEAFVGAPFEGAVAMHKNDDSTDNRIENLRWGTHAENLSTPDVRRKHSEYKTAYWARWREERAARQAA